MWIKALDIILDRLRINGLDYSQVCGISGCAQQHGSVYWKKNSLSILNNLNSTGFLHEQLANCFSLQDSPVWMDSSTSEQCAQLEASIGGPEMLAKLTGSRAYERFTGNQIAKIIQTKKDVYNQTERISLVSSFLASIFIGNYAPIDMSDGSGMNLYNIVEKEWSSECIKHISSNYDDLLEKLGKNVISPNSTIGNISNYFVQRYGFNEKCYVAAFTGDNPASYAGLCLGPNDMAISLGTSDTAFFTLTKPLPSIDGHIFCNPINQEHYMGMICYKNGSLTRERIRNSCSDKCWTKFNRLLESTSRGNFGNIGFYFDLKEIYPVIRGDYRYNCYNNEVISFAPEVEIRACIEGQFLRLKIHAENLGFQTDENTRILATGGASTNESIVKVLADVFNASVYTHSIANSAAFGSALLAKYAAEKETINYYEMTEKLKTKFKFIANASTDAKQIYGSMAERYRNLENELNKNYFKFN